MNSNNTFLLNNRYQLVEQIGEGGMANVYLAIDNILNRKVAIKVLRGDLSNDEKFVARFQREAMASTTLQHPNLVQVYDVGQEQNYHYIVMEYIEGKTLKQLLKQYGPLTVGEVIDVMEQLVSAVEHAHSRGIIHRDIKPQNIMVRSDGTVKLTDFGIAFAQNAAQLT
ncbi:MAG: protein kinase domain-containing protein, partial [Bacilli bacterium]